MGKLESRLCGGSCGNELLTEGDREIRFGRVWEVGQKTSVPK